MRIEEIFESIFDDEPQSLQFADDRGKLKLSNKESVQYLYRTVSKEEYNDIKESGVIKPSQFYQRIHASAVPTGGDSDAYKVLKIEYDESDGWKPKEASTGVFAVTYNEIPYTKFAEILSTNAVKEANMMSLEEQFGEFQR